MLFLTTNLLCVIKLLTVPERKRDMKTIMKDLLIIATMMVGLIGVTAFCLFAPPIPLWVSLPIVAVWTAWIVKGVIQCR
jgi:nitric oxide reductase large subunit